MSENAPADMDSVAQDWVHRLRGGPEIRDPAINELRKILERGLQKSLVHRYGGQVSPEDVAQEAVLKILDSLDQFAGRSQFITWAMTIATRIGISELRHKHYRDVSLNQLMSDQTEHTFDLPDQNSESGDQRLQQAEILQQLQRLIEQALSPRQQLAIRGMLAGWPVEVIAEKMNSNRNATYKLIHDARKQLKMALEEVGISAPVIHQLFF